jgi:hypothetical protein
MATNDPTLLPRLRARVEALGFQLFSDGSAGPTGPVFYICEPRTHVWNISPRRSCTSRSGSSTRRASVAGEHRAR